MPHKIRFICILSRDVPGWWIFTFLEPKCIYLTFNCQNRYLLLLVITENILYLKNTSYDKISELQLLTFKICKIFLFKPQNPKQGDRKSLAEKYFSWCWRSVLSEGDQFQGLFTINSLPPLTRSKLCRPLLTVISGNSSILNNFQENLL